MNDEELKEAARDARRALDRKREEIRQLLDVREQKVEVEKQHLEAETSQKPMEIHNHFGRGCSAQVFNDKVTGKFVRKEKKRKWKKMVRKML
jgi:uncharacterized protein with PIN domain